MDRTGCGLHALLTQQSQTSFIKIKRMEIYWVLSHNNGHITWCFMKTNSRCKNIFNNVTKKPRPPERPLTSLVTNKDKLQQAINQEPIISCLWRVHKKFLKGQATIKKVSAIDTRNPPQHQPDPLVEREPEGWPWYKLSPPLITSSWTLSSPVWENLVLFLKIFLLSFST